MITRFYVGVNAARLASHVIHAGLEGFTLIPAVGYWAGKREECTILEVVGACPRGLARTLGRALGEECVLRTETVGTWEVVPCTD